MEGCANCARLTAERLLLDKRIHKQRVSLRANWEIVEMRAKGNRRLFNRLWRKTNEALDALGVEPAAKGESVFHRLARIAPPQEGR